jgi:hypothetical protein
MRQHPANTLWAVVDATSLEFDHLELATTPKPDPMPDQRSSSDKEWMTYKSKVTVQTTLAYGPPSYA